MWQSKCISELSAIPLRNGIYKPKEFHGRGTKIVNMGELFAHRFLSDQEMRRLELSDSELATSLLEDGDLLFARRSIVADGAGKCTLVSSPSEPLTFESSIIRVRLDRAIAHPGFYFYYFSSPLGRANVLSIVTGAAVTGIRGSELSRLNVPHPPYIDQERIASTLLDYDNLIENNLRRIQLLEETAQLIYKEWFVHLRFPGVEHCTMVDGAPNGWGKASLIDMAAFTMGQSPSSEFYNEDGIGLPFHQGVTGFCHRFVTHEKWCTEKTRLASPGDILFSVRAPVGRINITRDEIVIGRGIAAMRHRRGYQSFLLYLLKDVFFKEDMIGGGAIFASVTKGQLESVQVSSPPLHIIEQFEAIVNPIDDQIGVLEIQCTKLREARDLLLPRLISGEIEV